MRPVLAVVALSLVVTTSLRAQEQAPPVPNPATPDLAPTQPTEPTGPTQPTEPKPIEPRDDDGKPDAKKPDEKKPDEKKPETPKKNELKPRLPKPDEGGFGGAACIGSSVGCGALGCLPAVGSAAGGALLLTSLGVGVASSGALGACAQFGAIGGGAVGGASALLLGPCASGGALIGGVAGAAFDGRSVTPVVVGALPGLVTGVASTAGVVWGLVALSNSSADHTTPAIILASSTLLALLSGPITVLGETIVDGVAGAPVPETKAAVNARDPMSRAHVSRGAPTEVSLRAMAF